MFPTAHSVVYRNEEGEVIGWDNPPDDYEPDPYDDDRRDYDDEPPPGMEFCKGCGETKPTGQFDHALTGWAHCITCRISDFLVNVFGDQRQHPRRAHRAKVSTR